MMPLLVFISLVLLTTNPAERYRKAEELELAGSYREAISEFKRLKKSLPDFEKELDFRICECYFNSRKLDRALECFLNLRKKVKGTYLEPEVLYLLGLTAVLLEDTAVAEEAFRRLAEFREWRGLERARIGEALLFYRLGMFDKVMLKTEGIDDPLALFLKGRSLIHLGRPREAMPLFDRVMRETEDSTLIGLAVFSQGQALLDYGDFSGAFNRFDAYLRNFSGELQPYAQFLAGLSLFRDKRYEEALSYLKMSSECSDRDIIAGSLYLIGECNLRLGDTEEAGRYFSQVIKKYRNTSVFPYALIKSSVTYIKKGDVETATNVASKLLQQVLDKTLSGIDAYVLGSIYFSNRDYEEAAKHFEKLIQVAQDTLLLQLGFAMLLNSLREANENDRAIAIGAGFLAEHKSLRGPFMAKAFYYLAEAYYYTGNYPEAEEFYHRVIMEYPDDDVAPFAEIGYGFTLAHIGRYEEAIRAFKHLIEHYPDDTLISPYAQYGLATVYFNSKDYDKALALFEHIVKTYSEKADLASNALYYTGLAYYQLGYYLQAIKSWERLLSEYPQSEKVALAALRAGDTYYKAAEYDKAIALFRWITQRFPNSEEARTAQLMIAQAYYNRKDFDKAIEEFTKFLELYPDDERKSAAREGLALSLYRKGESDTCALRTLAENFKDLEIAAQARFKLAKEFMEDGRYRDAAGEFERLVMDFPQNELAEKAQLLQAECFALMGDWEKSERGYRKFLEFFPNSEDIPLALYNLGVAQFNLDKMEKAAETFERLIDEYPSSKYAGKARQYLAFAYRKLGKPEKAVEVLEEMSSSDFDLKAEAAEMLIEEGEYDKAVEILRTATPEADDEKARYHYLLGRAYLEEGDTARAIRSFLNLKGFQVNSRYWKKGMADLGTLLEKEGRLTEATEVYKKLLSVVEREELRKALTEKINYLESIQGGSPR